MTGFIIRLVSRVVSVLEGLVAGLGWSVSSLGAVHVAGIFRLCLVSSRLRFGSGVVEGAWYPLAPTWVPRRGCSPRLGVCGFPRTLSCVFFGRMGLSHLVVFTAVQVARVLGQSCLCVRAFGLGSRVPFSVNTTPQMTCFPGAKVCTKWLEGKVMMN